MKLYKFYKDFGRHGTLEGLFVAGDEDIKYLKNKHLDFGEALGKHSEVCFDFKMSQISVISEDKHFITKFNEILPHGVGTSPFDGLVE